MTRGPVPRTVARAALRQHRLPSNAEAQTCTGLHGAEAAAGAEK